MFDCKSYVIESFETVNQDKASFETVDIFTAKQGLLLFFGIGKSL